MNFLKSMGEKVAAKVGSTWNATKEIIKSEIENLKEEQDKIIAENEAEETKKKSALYPWEKLRAINSNINGNMTDIVKEEIIELSSKEENFLIEEENYMYEFTFKMDEFIYVALKMYDYDPRLPAMRKKLVPSKITEENFWKNYFYNIEVIKLKNNMHNRIQDHKGNVIPDVEVKEEEQVNFSINVDEPHSENI